MIAFCDYSENHILFLILVCALNGKFIGGPIWEPELDWLYNNFDLCCFFSKKKKKLYLRKGASMSVLVSLHMCSSELLKNLHNTARRHLAHSTRCGWFANPGIRSTAASLTRERLSFTRSWDVDSRVRRDIPLSALKTRCEDLWRRRAYENQPAKLNWMESLEKSKNDQRRASTTSSSTSPLVLIFDPSKFIVAAFYEMHGWDRLEIILQILHRSIKGIRTLAAGFPFFSCSFISSSGGKPSHPIVYGLPRATGILLVFPTFLGRAGA